MAPRAPRIYRGSKRRLRNVRMRGNSSPGLWLLVGVLLITLFVLVPWLIGHPGPGPRSAATGDMRFK